MSITLAQALISGPSRMIGLASAGTAMAIGAELTLRGLITVSTLLQKQEINDIDFTEKNEFSKKIVDLRPARAQSTKELLKIFMITAVATAVIMEFNYRTFGPPIKGINLIGKYIGVQVTDNGILDNVRTVGIADWTEFFHQS